MAIVAAAVAAYTLTRGAARRATPRSRLGQAGRRRVPAASGAGGPPVSVSLITVQKRDVDVMLDATGTVTALNSVDVRPQIASTITKVHIREGQFVTRRPAAVHARCAQRRGQRHQGPGAARQGPGGARRRAAAAGAQQGPVRPELHLAGRGRHQPDAGRFAAGRGRRPTGRRSRRRRSACRTAGSSRRRRARRRDQRLSRQLRAAERHRAGDDHPARPDRRRLQPAAAQPRPGAGGAARRRRQGHGDASRVRRQRAAASCSSSTTRSTRTPARCASRPSSPTRTSGSGPAPSSTSGSRCRRSKGASVIPQAAIIQCAARQDGLRRRCRPARRRRGRSRCSMPSGERRRGERRRRRRAGGASTAGRTCAPARA